MRAGSWQIPCISPTWLRFEESGSASSGFNMDGARFAIGIDPQVTVRANGSHGTWENTQWHSQIGRQNSVKELDLCRPCDITIRQPTSRRMAIIQNLCWDTPTSTQWTLLSKTCWLAEDSFSKYGSSPNCYVAYVCVYKCRLAPASPSQKLDVLLSYLIGFNQYDQSGKFYIV